MRIFISLFISVLIVAWNGFILSAYAFPKPELETSGSSEKEKLITSTSSPNNETDVASLETHDILGDSYEAVARTISGRTGKALGVPSDFTKHFNTSFGEEEEPPKEDQSASSQLNAGPAVEAPENTSVSPDEIGKGNANDSISDATAKPVESVQQKLQLKPSRPTISSEDKAIQKVFGGTCTMEIWDRCSRITFWGGDYIVPDRNDPEKKIVKHYKIQCQDPSEKTLCLKNGWTVQRCHMLCMSQCNLDYRLHYEKLVAHEGDCRLAIL